MTRGTGALTTIAAAAALTVAGPAAARTDVTTLHGTVGPGFSINLTQNGKRVTRLKGGTYRIVVADRSPVHNFELEQESGGRAKRDVTSVSFTGTKTVTMRLANGSWKFYCDPHATSMRGFFTVGAGAAAPATTTTDDHGGAEPGDDKGGRR
jgi:plastocyanin